MLFKNIKFFLLTFLISYNCLSAIKATGIYSGEEASLMYYGPFDPAIKKEKSKVVFKDQIFYERYIEGNISEAFFDLERFYNNELKLNASCPEFHYKKNSEYIKYLYRLISLSYLYESMKKSHYTLYSLGGKLGSCPKNLKKIFERCRPETLDMKKFIKRAKFFFDRKVTRHKYKQMDSNSRMRWLSTFEFRKESKIPSSRISSWCEKTSTSCENLKIKVAIKALTTTCEEDANLAELICNEKDSLYGMSKVNIATQLLVSSHSKNMINKGGYGHSCVQRFRDSNEFKERDYYQMKDIFKVVSLNMKKNRSAYLQGELFLPGSLKEFDDLGLRDFIFKKKKIAKKIKITKKKKKKLEKVEALAMPKVKTKVKKIRKIKPKISAKIKFIKKKKLSYFETRHLEFLKGSSKKIVLEQIKYKKSYKFSKRFIQKMQGPLEVYKTRVAISDMLKYDKIGSFENPFQISFIKYLIDYDEHQGLFNIVSIMGDSFYIKNDIEKKKVPIFIELLNDESSNYLWQLAFINPKMKKK